MATICAQCGALLADGQAFCTSCGTRKSEAAQDSAQRYCSGCGSPLAPNSSFCNKCGARVGSSNATAPPVNTTAPVNPPTPVSPQTTPVQSVTPIQPPQKKQGSLLFKVFIAFAVLIVLVVLAVGAGVAYLGYIAKKRVTAAEKAYKHGDLGGMIAAATGKDTKPQPLPAWKPAPASLISSPASKVPLRVSLRLVETGNDALLGDYESVFKVDSMNDKSMHVKAAQQYPAGQGFERFFQEKSDATKKANNIDWGRTVFLKDLANSAETDGYFCRQNREEQHPGTTAMGLSRKTLKDLRNSGQSEMTFHEDPLKALFKSFKNVMGSGPSDQASQDAAAQDLLKKMMNFAPGVSGQNDPMETPPVKCALRKEGADMAFPVLVNDQPAELPVMHIVCKPADSDHEAHLYVLDDPDNPLILAAGSNTGEGGQVTKIYWDVPKENKLADELEKTGRAKVYDLYFDFRSAKLRPESDKVLKEIAQVMQEHPDWKLSVEGNTDNIGGNAYNLDLSKRRAAAVKQALVTSYDIAPDRLTTTGFGESHPIDTNDTMEGRARNRRVELAKE